MVHNECAVKLLRLADLEQETGVAVPSANTRVEFAYRLAADPG